MEDSLKYLKSLKDYSENLINLNYEEENLYYLMLLYSLDTLKGVRASLLSYDANTLSLRNKKSILFEVGRPVIENVNERLADIVIDLEVDFRRNAMLDKQLIRLNDVSSEKTLSTAFDEALGITPVNILVYPYYLNEEFIGIIEIVRDVTQEVFSEAETSFFSVLLNFSSTLILDIRANKELERQAEELRQSAEELKRSNESLLNLAQLASQNLKEPLVMIRNYIELLKTKYKEDEQADEVIESTVKGTKRMSALIDDLISYSKVDESRKHFKEIDMNVVVRYALSNMKNELDSAEAKVTVQTLPSIYADATQILKLIQHLLANAIAYRRDEPPVITVTCKGLHDEWVFSVQDNGIGIPEDKVGDVFGMFKRFNEAQRPGTGVGLAICKRIIEIHNGRIWVESKEGVGSTFFFMIPKKEG